MKTQSQQKKDSILARTRDLEVFIQMLQERILQGVPQNSLHLVFLKLLKIENIQKWNFNIPWIPWFMSFLNYIEPLLSFYSEISYSHKRKRDLELKLTFYNLKYKKSIKTQSTIIVF